MTTAEKNTDLTYNPELPFPGDELGNISAGALCVKCGVDTVHATLMRRLRRGTDKIPFWVCTECKLMTDARIPGFFDPSL